MRKCLLGLILFALVLCPLRGHAEMGVLDNVPAATLLLPYFEVDLANPNGITTLFSVNVGEASAYLVQVTLWSDLGIPTQAFNIYLTGYDTQTVNLRDIFNGVFPATASAGQDPTDTSNPNDGISNKGPISQDINFASCNGILPYAIPAISPQQISDLRSAHTGLASSLSGQCAGRRFGDNIARGYITIDSTSQCVSHIVSLFPSNPGYFISGGGGVANNRNELWGDYTLVNPGQNFAQSESLVALEASATAFVPGDYTFYSRFVANTAADNREPLATNWAAPYAQHGGDGTNTDLLVWRDSTVANVNQFQCFLLGPSQFFPLNLTDIVAFDSEENPTDITFSPPELPPFPGVAERVRVGGPGLSQVSPRSGWLYLNLNTAVPGGLVPPGVSQSYVTVIRSSQGRFSGGHSGIPLDDANDPILFPIFP
ncbi:MAG: hypothetical protein HOP18_24240 [Deltaproteobacteria bacterium]|nr:hypothetical protein [Deltaproteobacteria bacterium]